MFSSTQFNRVNFGAVIAMTVLSVFILIIVLQLLYLKSVGKNYFTINLLLAQCKNKSIFVLGTYCCIFLKHKG